MIEGKIMKVHTFLTSFVIALSIASCSLEDFENAIDPLTQEKLLEDISGVWRASDNSLVTLLYKDNQVQMIIDDSFVNATLGAVDTTNETVNLNAEIGVEKKGIWTIRKVWGANRADGFTISLTLHDGTYDELSFVRAITSDDKRRIDLLISEVTSKSSQTETGLDSPTITDNTPASADEQAFSENRSLSLYSPLLNPNGKITQGRCHMGSCSWVKWLSVVQARASSTEEELEVTLLGGDSVHEETSAYPSSHQDVEINWNPSPHTVKVTCSHSNPSVSVDDQTHLLALNPDTGIPGVLDSSAELYVVACHSYFSGYPSAIAEFGYKVYEPDSM